MSRLLYLGWVLAAAVLFLTALMFVLLNPQVVSLDLLVMGWQWQVPVGLAVVLGVVIGSLIGFLIGFGLTFTKTKSSNQGSHRAKP
jgi:uncharacterized integral membrane protein